MPCYLVPDLSFADAEAIWQVLPATYCHSVAGFCRQLIAIVLQVFVGNLLPYQNMSRFTRCTAVFYGSEGLILFILSSS